MIWKQKRLLCKTIPDVMEANTGNTIEELMNPKEFPYIAGLSDGVLVTKKCIAAGMNIHIIGDYDCDGETAAAILKLGLEEFTGEKIPVRLPRRFSEGYGLSGVMIDEINDGLVITVDNGIAAVEAVQKAKDKGLKVVIIDHHELREDGQIPPADAIVDPYAIPGSEYNGYCGAGLAYRFILELNPNTKLKDKLVALAGIGTIADVMPLIGDNRRIVRESLKAVGNRKVTGGLKSLLEAINISSYPTESDYGYRIGPCFNAAGRLEDAGAEKVVACISNDPDEYQSFIFQADLFEKAMELVNLNERRQKMVYETMQVLNRQMAEMQTVSNPIVLWGDYHEGLVGIFAGKLAEAYKRPALVFTDSATEGVIKGSGRSYGDTNLKAELDKCAGLFLGYGGHAGAAGMRLKKENLKPLERQMRKNLENMKAEDSGIEYYDLECSIEDIPFVCEELRKYAPFGAGCPKIRYLIRNFTAIPKGSSHFQIMGQFQNHVKLFGGNFNVMGFDMAERFRNEGEPMSMDIIGTLSVEWYMGQPVYTVEMIDYRKQEKKKTAAFSQLQSSFCFI